MATMLPKCARRSSCEPPWWKAPAACGLLALLTGCCAFVYTAQYLQLSVFAADSWTLPFLAPAAFLALVGLGAAGGGGLAQSRKAPMLYTARLALAGGAFAAVCPLWMAWVKSAHQAVGEYGPNSPAWAALAGLLAAGLAFLPIALIGGASLPAAAALAEDNGRTRGLFHASWFAGAALGAVAACMFFVSIAQPGLWAPSVVFLAVAIGANNLARISPAVTPENPPFRLSVAQSFPVWVFGLGWTVEALCLARLLRPALSMGYSIPVAVAFCMLLGAALGCALFSLRGKPGAPGVHACLGLMGFWLALAWAAGDKLVVLSDGLEPLKSQGLPFLLVVQALMAAFIVFPPAVAGGFLFCAMDREQECPCPGRRAGAVLSRLAWGAALGALLSAGLAYSGTAPSTLLWLACAALAAFSAALSLARLRARKQTAAPCLLIILSLLSFQALRYPGPTVAWTQHDASQGGTHVVGKDSNSVADWLRSVRRPIVWEANGPLGSTAIRAENSLALVENGVIRSNARLSAAREAMLGLAAAALHPKPCNALTLGLGSGCAAGWLAQVDSIRRVDVVEENPQSLEMARRCAPVNFQVLENPKVRVRLGGFRQALAWGNDRYDLLIQGAGAQPFPAQPGLGTAEYFKMAADRLAPGGVFCLSISLKGVDPATAQSIYGSLSRAFPQVHTFRPDPESLFLIASQTPILFREDALRKRLSSRPFDEAMTKAWGVNGLEGFFSRYFAGPGFARMLSDLAMRNDIAGADSSPKASALHAASQGRRRQPEFLSMGEKEARDQWHKPFFTQGGVNLRLSREWQVEMRVLENSKALDPALFSQDMEPLALACRSFQQGEHSQFLDQWEGLGLEPRSPLELAMNAYALAMEGNGMAQDLAERLSLSWPQESRVCLARLSWNTGEKARAMELLRQAFADLRNDPWPWPEAMAWGLDLAREMAEADKESARSIAAMLSSPFSLHVLEEKRKETLLAASLILGARETLAAMEQYGPHFPWTRDFLNQRLQACNAVQDPAALQALADMQAYLSNTLLDFSDALAYD